VTPELLDAELEAVFGTAAPPEHILDLKGKRFASSLGVWRVESNGESRVLKHLQLGAGPIPQWDSHAEVDSPFYWRREIEIYANGIPAPAPFRLPACTAFERGAGSVALWLEDAGDPEPWPSTDIADVARRLAAVEAPADPPDWLARGWLRRYLEVRAERYDPDLPAWRLREEILERIEAMPAVLAHNDFHPGNIFRNGGDPIVIDWAFSGLGVHGDDAGIFAADMLFDGFFPLEEAGFVLEHVWDAYSAALEPALVEDAEFAFFAGNALRYGWTRDWNNRFPEVYRAIAAAAAARIPSLG
jgi:hypothetical protein